MDIFELINGLVGSLAWPIAAIIIVIILRKPLVSLVPLLRKLRYKELELEFSETLSEIPLEKNEGKVKLEDTDERLQKYKLLVEMAPAAAITEAWSDVERAILNCAVRHNISAKAADSKNTSLLAKLLLFKDVISKNQYDSLNNLRELRNKVVHSEYFEISEKSAAGFVGFAALLILNIEKQ